MHEDRLDGFEGNGRFEVITRLGRGGMGAVYQVVDRERSARVALKTVGRVAGDSLLRFKREFRALQTLHHPNIVELGELFETDGEWFYTMELVQGDDFLSHVRHGRSASAPSGVETEEYDASGADHPPDEAGPHAAGSRVSSLQVLDSAIGFDEVRLRRSLAQLALAISLLHRRGHVHRDLKPANVLVAHGGRVVLIDFGLVTGIERRAQSTELHVVGTVDYMAPEQAAGRPVGPAADWYAVGVMLFEALTGARPFTGPTLQVLVRKQTETAPAPRDLVPGVPEDLDRLCVELLRSDPKGRPSDEAILARLHVEAGEALASSTDSMHERPTAFVGRARELARLEAAMSRVRSGEQAVVALVGPSGVGKSALVERFGADVVATSPDAVLLSGRCYEMESVPFKALDGVVDQLSRWLRRLPKEAVASLLPPDIEFLERAFPVLQRVPAIATARRSRLPVRDPQERRARVRSALRALIGEIARRWPTVIAIDDMQWADEDSFSLLGELLRAPGAPPCLFVFSLRSSGETTRDVLARIGEDPAVVQLGPLDLGESEELARRLAGPTVDAATLARLAKQAEGYPFFLETMLRGVLGEAPDLDAEMDLGSAILRRVSDLDASSRRLLEVVSVAGARVSQEVAAHAAELEPEELGPRLKVLRLANLLRTSGPFLSDAVEPYHDRIRATVVAAIEPARKRELHLALAYALEAHHGAPDALASQWIAAGDREIGGRHLRIAAQAASEVLAFERAAELYTHAIALGGSADELRELAVRRGEALASAGYGPRAAEAFAQAIPGSGPIEALTLRVRMAEQLLTCGRHAEGVSAALAFTEELDLRYSATPKRALVDLVGMRLRLGARGLGYRLRDRGTMSQEELLRIDACWAMTRGLLSQDPIRSQVFHARGLLLALACGEPYRIVRALAMEAAMVAAGSASKAAVQQLLETTTKLAEEIDHPNARAHVRLMDCQVRYWSALAWDVADEFADCETTFRTQCYDAAWEAGLCITSRAYCLFWLGRWREMITTAHGQVEEASVRGFHYVHSYLKGQVLSLAAVLDGDYAAAHACIADARDAIEGEPSPVQRFFFNSYGVAVCLAEGDVQRAVASMDPTRRMLEDSLILRAPIMRFCDRHDRLTVALAALRAGLPNARRHRSEAKRAVRQLASDPVLPSCALATFGRAALAANAGEQARARSLLEEAERAFEASQMSAHAHAVLARRGQLEGGVAGAAAIAKALDWFRDEGALVPEALLDMLTPGFEALPRASGA